MASIEIDLEACISCGLCVDSCPHDAFDWVWNDELGKQVPIWISDKCNFCVDQGGLPTICEDECPVGAITYVY